MATGGAGGGGGTGGPSTMTMALACGAFPNSDNLLVSAPRGTEGARDQHTGSVTTPRVRPSPTGPGYWPPIYRRPPRRPPPRRCPAPLRPRCLPSPPLHHPPNLPTGGAWGCFGDSVQTVPNTIGTLLAENSHCTPGSRCGSMTLGRVAI